ncbi:MAG TPA: HAD-IB family hydrolase [Candidatus Acidoferrales bacterium]|jgi:alcohol-forming fatty acyl-CoA reductase
MSVGVNQRGRIAAVFDIDGTLLPAPSLELRLLAHLALNGELHLRSISKWLRSLFASSLALDENKAYLEGVKISATQEWIAREFTELELFSDALKIVDWHRRRGHAIVLISGTLTPLARAVGTLFADNDEIFVRATKLECNGDRWSGRVNGEAICGPAKERALTRLAAKHHFDLTRSYAYADSWKDRWLLAAVGHPVVVNSAPRMARHGRRCGWRLINWNDRVCVPALRNRNTPSGAEISRKVFAEKVSWK